MQVKSYATDSPLGLEWQVRRSLRLIDPVHLEGIEGVYIQDELPDTLKLENQVEWVKRVYEQGTITHVSGWYAEPGEDTPPYIMLYARPIYRGIPFLLRWSTAPVLCILRTLAHEVAHHLMATRGFVFHDGEDITDKEGLAERYAASVEQRAITRWRYKLGRFWLKELAGCYYAFGSVDWGHKNYCTAARYFFDAWHLDPEHELASYWYWRAKEMCSQKSE